MEVFMPLDFMAAEKLNIFYLLRLTLSLVFVCESFEEFMTELTNG